MPTDSFFDQRRAREVDVGPLRSGTSTREAPTNARRPAFDGTRDLIQTPHAVLRNYPISAHPRFLLEQIRPEMRQYFFEDEKDGRPFSRDKRAVAYQRAKMVLDNRPSGTQYDVYAQGLASFGTRRRSKNTSKIREPRFPAQKCYFRVSREL